MSTGAYAFLLFRDPEHLIPGIDALGALPAVSAWHAVDGHYHLVLALGEAGNGIRSELEAIPGIEEVHLCPVEKELVGGFTPDPALCHAWLTMEIDAGRRDDVERAFAQLPALRFGALAFGACGCVAALTDDTFEAIDAAVDAHIRPLDGVLRVKREWIIDLTQL